jgi:hypothetical protein
MLPGHPLRAISHNPRPNLLLKKSFVYGDRKTQSAIDRRCYKFLQCAQYSAAAKKCCNDYEPITGRTGRSPYVHARIHSHAQRPPHSRRRRQPPLTRIPQALIVCGVHAGTATDSATASDDSGVSRASFLPCNGLGMPQQAGIAAHCTDQQDRRRNAYENSSFV